MSTTLIKDRSYSRTSNKSGNPHPLCVSGYLGAANIRKSAGARHLPKARAKIASQQGFDPSLFEPPREVDHVRRQLLRQEKLAPALDVVPPTAFDGPTPPGEDPGHLVSTQVRPRGPAMAEAMPDKSEAVRVDVQRVEAARQYRAQLIRGWKQPRLALSLVTCQDEQKRSDRRLLHDDRLPPPCLRLR